MANHSAAIAPQLTATVHGLFASSGPSPKPLPVSGSSLSPNRSLAPYLGGRPGNRRLRALRAVDGRYLTIGQFISFTECGIGQAFFDLSGEKGDNGGDYLGQAR